ncbi:MAG: tetratricopeptide repeat protein, partial [Candidatus Bipolaricaulota bacterium]
ALDDSLAEAHTSLAGIITLIERDVEKAERLLRRAIQLDPANALSHANLAILLVATGRRDEALETIRAALALNPLSPRLVLYYAHCLFASKQYIWAADQARKAIELDPESDIAWWTLWFSHAAVWDWERGEAVLREMVERHPTNPLAWVFYSVSVQTNGRVQEGVDLLEKALALPGFADNSRNVFQTATNLAFAGDYERALELLDAGLKRWPKHEGLLMIRAFCYFLLNRYDDALQELETLDPWIGEWEAYVPRLRGRIYAARGEVGRAEAELRKLMEGGELRNRRICIAYLLAGLGRIEESIDWFEKAADIHEFHIATIRNMPTAPQELRDHPRFQAFMRRVGLADTLGDPRD